MKTTGGADLAPPYGMRVNACLVVFHLYMNQTISHSHGMIHQYIELELELELEIFAITLGSNFFLLNADAPTTQASISRGRLG